MTRAHGILLSLLLTTSAFADSADVRILATAFNLFSGTFVVVNDGPDVARNVVVTIDLPEGLTITRASFDAVPCNTSVRPIRCVLGGDVFPKAMFPRYGGIDVTGPLADATYNVTFTVSSETPDPNTGNNAASVSWTTKIEADLAVLVKSQTERVDPGGAGSFVANICNSVRNNVPPDVRAELSLANGTITSITPATGFTCTVDGANAVCTTKALTGDCPAQPFRIDVLTKLGRSGDDATLTLRATPHIAEQKPENNESTDAVPVYRWITVTNTADSGPGSLRAAIDDANANCTPGPCRMLFEIAEPRPQGDSWFTITPLTPLPPITAERIRIEGTSQTRFMGDLNTEGPEIAIDGHLAHRGLKVLAKCEAVVEGLAIGNFDEDQGLWVSTGAFCNGRPDKHEVTDSYIGLHPQGTMPWPNLRGLRADDSNNLTIARNRISENLHSGIWIWRGTSYITQNRIERNGSSGILLGPLVSFSTIERNTIAGHPQMGLALAPSIGSITARYNVIKDNGGLGIDWGLDGVSPNDGEDHDGPPNAPLLLSARYDAGRDVTVIVASVQSTPVGKYYNDGFFDFYANDSPDADGERWIGSAHALPKQTVTAALPGDQRGKWINATWTRMFSVYSRTPGDPAADNHDGGFGQATSELSNAVRVE